MRCADAVSRSAWKWGLAVALLGALLIALGACSLLSKNGSKPAPAPTPGTTPAPPLAASKTVPSAKGPIKLPPPDTPRSWAAARLQAAKRMVMANPDGIYTGTPPDILMAIPVMSIELYADGSIRAITVLRYPSQARETVDMAIAAIKRAAPFGDVSKLPKPWKFNETFLFNADFKFKPMTLDQR
ncbi:MAG: hypothetical protein QM749_00515 [Aquabacterium sp.]